MSPSLYRGEFQSPHRWAGLPRRVASDRGDRPGSRDAHRRSTTFLAQAVEHSWLKAAIRSKTRHLRLDLGADEDRAGAGTEQARRARGVGSSPWTSWCSEQELRLSEGRHQLHSDYCAAPQSLRLSPFSCWRHGLTDLSASSAALSN